MSVVTALSLAFLLIFSPLISASAIACPECEEGQPPPVYVTKTEPCDECEHEKPTPYVPSALTSTISTCRSRRSVIPYTSGSSTFYISTTTLTEQGTCKTHTKQGTCETVTAAGSTLTTTSVRTATVYKNGTNIGPVQISTVNLTAPPTTETRTITSWRSGPAPATVTVVQTETDVTRRVRTKTG